MPVVEMREALRQAIDEEMARDPHVFIMGEEVGHYQGAYKVTKGLLEKWGAHRVIDTPICEATFAGLGIGAAITGLRPIVEFMSFNFSLLAFDQIISNASKLYYMSGNRFSVPIVFRGPNGAAAQVSCQHSNCVDSIYAHFPGLIVLAPSNAYDAKGLLKSAIRNNNPVLFLESELLYSNKAEIPEEEYLIPIGKSSCIRPGTDITLLSYSRMTHLTLQAAEILAKEGISAEIIDLRSIKPFDIKAISQSIEKTHFCLVIEEGYSFAGIASELISQIQEHCFSDLDAPIGRVSQRPIPSLIQKNLNKTAFQQ